MKSEIRVELSEDGQSATQHVRAIMISTQSARPFFPRLIAHSGRFQGSINFRENRSRIHNADQIDQSSRNQAFSLSFHRQNDVQRFGKTERVFSASGHGLTSRNLIDSDCASVSENKKNSPPVNRNVRTQNLLPQLDHFSPSGTLLSQWVSSVPSTKTVTRYGSAMSSNSRSWLSHSAHEIA